MWSISLDQFVGSPEKEKSNVAKIYPNPATDYVVADLEHSNTFTYKIYNTAGRIVQEGYAIGSQKIDISGLSKGIYVLSAREGYFSAKFVKD
jgi:hypothetical protein